MLFTDSHCHINFRQFNENREQILTNCYAAGIKRIIVPAVCQKHWSNLLTIRDKSRSLPLIFPALGIHPWYLNHADLSDLSELDQMLSDNKGKVVAVGEIGVDKPIADNENSKFPIDRQIEFFSKQLQLAKKHILPVIVHHRKSHSLILPWLKKMSLEKAGVIHGFTGSYQQAVSYLDLGYKLGIGGSITYERAVKTINTIKKLPITSIVLETDAPSMPLSGFQGEINSPLKIINVFDALVKLRQETPEQLAIQIELNIDQLFFS